MLNTQFPPWPSFTKEEADAIGRVLLSNRVNYWTGTQSREFEKEFAAWAGTKRAIALANGTVALDVALRVLDIGPGDDVIVTPRTFLASASSIVLAGARPVFADVDLDSQNITAQSIETAWTPATRAVMCVHLAGWPCEMDGIRDLARQRKVAIIEDCAQAHGAQYKGRPVGSLGDIAAWSFCQDKIMTTGGEGGMVTVDNEDLWRAAWSFKDHGKSWDAVYNQKHPAGFRWLHESFGTNGRITEMQSVIGRAQLRRMPEWHASRAANASRILDACEVFDCVRAPRPAPHLQHAWYKCYVFVNPKKMAPGWSRDRIVAEINGAGVPCYTGSCSEVYLEKAFEGTGFRPSKRLPNAKILGETSLMFLVHPTLGEAEIDKTCRVIGEVMGQASL